MVTTAGHARGALLRAYDKATGADAGGVLMPAPQTGSPMSYMLGGRQYVVVAIAGAGYPGELVAYRVWPLVPPRLRPGSERGAGRALRLGWRLYG